jgi:hypothetical protein
MLLARPREGSRTAPEVANEAAKVVADDQVLDCVLVAQKMTNDEESCCVLEHDIPMDLMDVTNDVELKNLQCLRCDQSSSDESCDKSLISENETLWVDQDLACAIFKPTPDWLQSR